MKIKMRKKRISIFLCLSLFLSFLWGCSQNTVTETDSTAGLKPIGEPPVSMKEVTQDDKDSWSTFHLQIPEDWVCVPDALSGIYAMSEKELEEQGIENLPSTLNEAIHYMKQDPFIRKALGDHVFDKYIEAKRQEWREYSTRVSQWEIERYLNKF